LPKTWGFPATKWGLAYTNLSDYFESDKTIISTGFTFLPEEALRASEEELIAEALAQLRESYPDLPDPDHAVMGSHLGEDTAYIQGVTDPKPLPMKLSDGIYTVGAHTGKGSYAFTSMEAAITNAYYLSNKLGCKEKITSSWTLNMAVICALVILLLLLYVYQTYKNFPGLVESHSAQLYFAT
jgi:hypothetical protein